MSWNRVVGQHSVVRLLMQAAASDRLPHGLLLKGDTGAGTLALAIALARTITCDKPITTGGYGPCDTCHSCVQNHTLQHPNISIITALPAGKADTENDLPQDVVDELAHNIRELATDAYAPFNLTGATQIKIGQIREIKRQLSMSAMQSGRRVVIIHLVETMTVEAANAFLKALEEPQSNVLLILTSEAPERLLPTITSRCQQLSVPPIDDDDIVAALIAEGVELQEAMLVAPFARGNMTLARAYLREDVQAERATVLTLLRTAMRGRDFRIALIDAIAGATDRRDRTRTLLMLNLLALWFRDVQTVLALGTDATITNLDQRESVVRFASSFGTADFSLALDIVDRGVRDVRRNVAQNTILLSTLLMLRTHFYKSIKANA